MARANIFNAFVCVSALAQVQFAVQDVGTTPVSRVGMTAPRDAPYHPRVVNASNTYLFVSWQAPKNQNTSGELANYVVNYYPTSDNTDTSKHEQKSLSVNETSCFLKGLGPGTKYSFFIVANYTSGQLSKSMTIRYQLPGFGPDNPCQCNHLGSNGTMYNMCNPQTGQCVCKKYTTGLHCDNCTKHAYWHPRLGCQSCGCPVGKASDGRCYLNEKGLKMCYCLNNHGGRTCGGCRNGLYLVGGLQCQPCDCHNNLNRTASSKTCDDQTGDCLSCGYNTTGDRCERCKPGFIGSALARNCTYDLKAPYGESAEQLNHSLVIGLTLGLITIITVTTIILAYIKCRRKKKPFNFWTVQLRDDHENVNFSSMMEQDNSYCEGSVVSGGAPASRQAHQDKSPSRTSSGNMYRQVKT